MHEGHRDRVKKRFRQEGLDHFSDIQALELLLFYGIPRVDTNPIAHALLDRFGSLSQVLEASPEELMKVPGVGENACGKTGACPAWRSARPASVAWNAMPKSVGPASGDFAGVIRVQRFNRIDAVDLFNDLVRGDDIVKSPAVRSADIASSAT